ncbi:MULTISPECIES: hypothetical protein [unclassified Nitrospina]|uniref:hypothetical protein n=1 Tax=unclassified Nitrospina TaxID=2638683 RepID=UPI003F95FF4F
MEKDLPEKILNSCDQLSNDWSIIFNEIDGLLGPNNERIVLENQIPQINISLSELNTRFFASLNLIKSLDLKNDSILLPTHQIKTIHSTLQSVGSNLANLKKNLSLLKGKKIESVDTENFQIQSENGEVKIQLQGIFKPVNDGLDSLLSLYYSLTIPLKSNEFLNFSNLISQISERIKELDKKKNLIEDSLARIKEQETTINTIKNSSNDLLGQINKFKQESENSRKTISEYEAEATKKRATIEEISKQAEKLQVSVENYQAEFNHFQETLDERVKSFSRNKEEQEKNIKEGKAEQQRVIETLQEKEEEIDRLINQSETMLKGATVAGLASSFGAIRDDLNEKLEKAQRGFYWSIGILFLSALPLMSFLIPDIFFEIFLGSKPLNTNTGQSKESLNYFGEILLRALLLIPAAWLTKFAAARHAQLFRLKEHYAYKYSIAVSVEGFQKQAEPYKDEIAASTYYELMFNPADRMETSVNEAMHPNPALEWFMKKLGLTPDGKPSE